MNEKKLESLWEYIPVGKENALTYDELRFAFDMNRRQVRQLLHELSAYDSGDGFILIRSANTKGFYKTADKSEIEAYAVEILNKSRSILAPMDKITRILHE